MTERNRPSFTEEQRRAIERTEGPMLVIAGPGSGKTTVLTHRLMTLICEKGADPRAILVITFTRQAAEEMKERLVRLLPEAEGKMPLFSTLHAAFYAMLRREDERYGRRIRLIEESEAASFAAEYLHEHEGLSGQEALWKAERLLSVHSAFINTSLLSAAALSYVFRKDPLEAYKSFASAYQHFKQKMGRVDFDDMMQALEALFRQHPEILKKYQHAFHYILVDEFQDVNRLQYELLRVLSLRHQNIFAVGDDDQSIYGFRGSSPAFMQTFLKDYPNCETVMLTRNFRCAPGIVRFTSRLIEKNGQRMQKDLVSAQAHQKAVIQFRKCRNDKTQAAWISRKIREILQQQPESSAAVLVRTHKELRPLRKALAIEGLEEAGVYSGIQQDLLAYLKWIRDPADTESLRKILNKPRRHLSSAVIDRFEEGKLEPGEFPAWDELSALREKCAAASPDDVLWMVWKRMNYRQYAMEVQESWEISWKTVERHVRKMLAEAEQAGTLEGLISRWERDPAILRTGNLHLMTMHGAKGLEFDHVFIPGLNEGAMPLKQAILEDGAEEERRVLYVAMTRARTHLYLSCTKEREVSSFLTPLLE